MMKLWLKIKNEELREKEEVESLVESDYKMEQEPVATCEAGSVFFTSI